MLDNLFKLINFFPIVLSRAEETRQCSGRKAYGGLWDPHGVQCEAPKQSEYPLHLQIVH
jgi:hypothetical protein